MTEFTVNVYAREKIADSMESNRQKKKKLCIFGAQLILLTRMVCPKPNHFYDYVISLIHFPS